jgi:hypothetical protein
MTVNAQDPSLTINVAAMEEALAVIKARPDLHYQGAYTLGDFALRYHNDGIEGMEPFILQAGGAYCGTAACFAGWIGVLNAESYGYIHGFSGEVYIEKTKKHDLQHWGIHVSELSTKICGLTPYQASVLYSASNTVEMLEAMVKDLANTGDLRDHEDYIREDCAHSAG